MSPAGAQPHHHFLVVVFPAQGHINPAIQLSKRLLQSCAATVTLATTFSAHKRMTTTPTSFPDNLYLAAISDGYDDNPYKTNDLHDADNYLSNFKSHGSQTLAQLIRSSATEGRPVTCLVHTIMMSWASEVARSFHIPCALLWTQSATIFAIYYHYFHGGYGDAIIIGCTENDPEWSIKLPGLPLSFKSEDLPTIFSPGSPHGFALKGFREQFEALREEPKPRVLVNTFDELEPDALRALVERNFRVSAVGPFLPSAFLDGKDPLDRNSGANLFKGAENRDYLRWLDSKPESSVVYVSFGSIAVLTRRQMEELGRGLMGTGRPFLWVVRAKERGDAGGREEEEEEGMRRLVEGGGGVGMVVPWCSQVEVLSHKAVGCFLTHCGWNSTIEGLASGVPMVGFPQWIDQTTNAKMIEDEWRVGVRLRVQRKEEDQEGIVESEEIKRCVEIVMDHHQREEMRMNARKLREMAVEAAVDGGSANRNLREFVDDVVGSTRSNVK